MNRKLHALVILFVLFISVPTFASALTSNITQLVFITDVQSIEPGTLSKVITIQAQNASGGAEDVDETNDVQFTSSSNTGEFLNDKGSAVSTTMSKNTASRNFYYRDGTVGEATLTVKITGRVSGKSFSASQKITLGPGAPVADEDDTTPTTTTTTTTSSSSSGSGNGGGSHSSYVTTTSVNEAPPFEIGAGRPRMTTTGSPISFVVQASTKSDISNGRFLWTFGDGESGDGRSIEHAYLFPGEYSVVLNGERDGKEAVSRTTVKVSEANLSLRVVPGGLEITNKSASEINIGEWVVTNGLQTKIFPRDTIILGSRSIVVPSEILKMQLQSLSLLDGLRRPVVTTQSSYTSEVGDDTLSKISVISEELEKIKATLVAVQEGRIGMKNISNAASIGGTRVESMPKEIRGSTTRSSFFDQVNHLFQSP